MSRAVLGLMAVLMLSTPAHAQSSKPLFKYGKWLMAAGALGLNYLASRDHDRADDRFHLLEQRCLGDARLCDLAPTGRYADATSESLYQESVHYDRRARRLLFGGEAALLGSAAIFVWELTRHSPKPDNIPFEPELRALNSATGVGLRVRF